MVAQSCKTERDARGVIVFCEALEDRRLLSGLTGTVIGTSGSYRNHPDVAGNAFDGNFNTFFDAPDASGDWVGLNLGTPAVITQIKYAPRATLAGRMVGGIFQASSSADFSSGVVNLFTITTAPAYGTFTTVPITNTTAFQYVRYIGPAQGYCNVAELEFDGTPQTAVALKVTPSGTAGSYGNSGNTFANAFDGNLNTYFDGPSGNGDYLQAAFSSEAILSQISYAPRAAYPSRMVGGVFQGSNSATFTSGVVNLYTITTAPAAGVFTTVPISTTSAYEYIRYIAPAGSFGNVAELQFFGSLTGIQPVVATNPSVTSSSPANGATGVDPSGFISCAVNLPNGAGVDPNTLTASTVYLYRTFDHTIIPTEVNTDAVGSVIVLQPQAPLDSNTQYTFVVTAGVKDLTGEAFTPYTITFTTGQAPTPSTPKIAFAKVALPTAVGQMFSGVTMGPDGDLYACTLTGGIFQFAVNADGTLGNPVNIAALAKMPARLITGIAFDPSSTAGKMTLWISSGNIAETDAPDFSGSIGALTITGTTIGAYQDYVVGLPRSNSNHLNDQPVFGPDGALYWCQGSNTSMGAPDSVWGYRPEHLLNAAILRLNIQLIEQYVTINKTALNVQTDSLPAGQTAYNPYASGAPLTIYATGIRNAFDLIWDNNGHLYAPTNGSAAGGNIPATPAGVTPAAPAENDVAQAEDDYLYDVVQGGYYGHPDPARGQYIFGGGNPINPAPNTAIQTAYPTGTDPDPNYRGYAYDFGVHYSPDGSIEYTGNAFGGALNGALLITEYSGGKDIKVLHTGTNGTITGATTGIAGFTGFEDPVDVIENTKNGNLYVADLGTDSITLLTPIASGATISVSATTLEFNAPINSSPSPVQTITITNTGTQPLAIPATGMSVVGTDGALFPIANKPLLPALIAPGASITVGIVFNPGNTALGLHTATLQVSSNDQTNPLISINLRALATAGIGGANQPSLAAILNLYQIPDNVGTANANQSDFTNPPQTPNDEAAITQFQKAGTGAVSITPLAAFDSSTNPAVGFGYYTAGSPASRSSLFTISSSDAQSVDPTPIGSTTFDPGTTAFGIYAAFDAYINAATGTARIAYSEGMFNTFDPAGTGLDVRFYPLKNSSGGVIANAYVFAIDDGSALPNYQFTNFVGIIRNVKPAVANGSAVIGTQNVAGTDNESAPSPLQFAFSSGKNNTADLRITSSGTAPLLISAMNISNAFFSIASTIKYPLTIPAGGSVDLTLAYNPLHSGASTTDTGVLTIKSNDPVHPTLTVQLSGLFIGTTQPTLTQIVSTFGYQSPTNETISSYWTKADANLPVTVQQLGAFSGKTTGSTLYWYNQGHNSSFNTIVTVPGTDTDSLLPVSNDTTKSPAIGFFSNSGIFGFSIDKTEFSDDALNAHGNPTDTGHHLKFFALYNSQGQLIPNTYLLAMSYTNTAGNYTFSDNVYLISNIKPAAPAMPTSPIVSSTLAGNNFSWTAVNSPLLASYVIYRSTSSNSGYLQIATVPAGTKSYLDTTAIPGQKYFYCLAAVDRFATLSTYTTGVAGTRPKNTTAPPQLSVVQLPGKTSVILSWNPSSAIDLAGYNIYRASSQTGTYFKLNPAPISATTFTDPDAPPTSNWWYEVTAVNLSGLESIPAIIYVPAGHS